ncbi:hypothetical protein ACFQHV_18675 [Promicromonospora thailandica]|uniref:hypothetical protein n=1 Tax=Promicromonospora thailandica TaxID=765201 RepID=UPI0036206DD1
MDYELFARHMNIGNPLECFLKGHLWLESCVNNAMEAHLANPDALRVDRMTFSAKVSLCDALGAFTSADLRALRTLNKLRNRLAHQLDADFDEAELLAIGNELDGHTAHLYHSPEREEGDGVQATIVFIIFALVTSLEFQNMRAVYHKRYQTEHIAFAARTMVRRNMSRYNPSLGSYDPERDDPAIREQVGLPEPPQPRDVWDGLSFPGQTGLSDDSAAP